MDEKKEKYFKVDMVKAVKNIVTNSGIPEENIKEMPFDTYKNNLFFSHYRAMRNRNNEKEGRFLGLVYIRGI